MSGKVVLGLAAMLMVAFALSGCTSGSDPKSLTEIFGEKGITGKGTNTTIAGDVLEGSLDGTTYATKALVKAHEEPKVTLPKTDPGPAGGGGTTHSLELKGVNATFKVRFMAKYDVSGYLVSWGTLGASGVYNWSAATDPATPASFAFNGPMGVNVKARLVQGTTVVATTANGIIGALNVKWTIDSAVRPVAPGDATGAGLPPPPRPANYAEHADRFKFTLAGNGGSVNIETKCRSTCVPPEGSDVDLEMLDPAGKQVDLDPASGNQYCIGSGGSNQPVANAENAHEIGDFGKLKPGVWTVVVGGVSCEANFFVNPGMVPYTVTISLNFGPVEEAADEA